MKGIIPAAGAGTRLYPLTAACGKVLLPVYDKPMVYYPLSTLMLAGVREVMLVVAPRDLAQFQTLLGDGSQWGMNIEYGLQAKPKGIAESLLVARGFVASDRAAVALGDNIFYGESFVHLLKSAAARQTGATVFGCHVDDPERFGVVEFDGDGRAISLEEKPEHPKSSYAVTGLYFYDGRAVDWVAELKPSDRGELEITDLNRMYLADGSLSVELLPRDGSWFDSGTMSSLLETAEFVRDVQVQRNTVIACPEEIAFNNGWIGERELADAASRFKKSTYGQYLNRICKKFSD